MSIFSYFRKHLVVSTLVVIVAIIIAIIGGRAANQKAVPEAEAGDKQVTLVNVALFKNGSATVSADGVVESRSQASLKSQTSAPVASINVGIGQNVSTGQVILELENSDIRAQLAQAQASLALAKGQYSTGAVSLDSARQNAVDKLSDAYNKTYDAVISDAEMVLYNNDGNGGRLASYTLETSLNSEITDLNIGLRESLRDWKKSLDTLKNSSSVENIRTTIKLAQVSMQNAGKLFNDMNRVLNDATVYATPGLATSLTSWKAIISGAQSSVSGANQALTAAELGLNTSSSTQGSTAQAQVSAAEAGVNNFQAQLAKTIIRSPIYGKVSALPLREGELASPGALLATVIGNESGLLVKAFVSGNDLSRIQIGGPVSIRGQRSNISSTTKDIKGTVSNIAPSVDALTKKAEVVINISADDSRALVIGQNVTAYISSVQNRPSSDLQNANIVYLLPIQNVKIIPGSAYVYTVGEDSTIKRNDVTVGEIQGDFIQVTSGLNDDMNIVSPVYELDPGQKVKVQ